MSHSLTPATCLRRCPKLVATDVAGETVVLNITQGFYYGLNPTGSRIWALLREPRPVGTLIELLQQEYEVEADRCASDLEPFLNELLTAQIIEIAS